MKTPECKFMIYEDLNNDGDSDWYCHCECNYRDKDMSVLKPCCGMLGCHYYIPEAEDAEEERVHPAPQRIYDPDTRIIAAPFVAICIGFMLIVYMVLLFAF